MKADTILYIREKMEPPTMSQTFNLNPQLETSSLWVQDLPLSQIRLKNDRRFPWVVLIPRRHDISEIFDLTSEDQHQLWREITLMAQHLHEICQADKMNIEILGNKVRQLHIHIIARYTNDPAWPNSILNHGESEPYLPEELADRIQEISCYENTY
jgi:diadenosine tetraphosphate (Ap4A) HIT family hydrolase